MGFNLLFWGFMFLFDFRLQGVDVLPDFVGYLLMYFGLSKLIALNVSFSKAKNYVFPLILFSVPDVFQVQVPVEEFAINPFSIVLFIVGIAVAVLDLFAVFYICQGIAGAAESHGMPALKELSVKRGQYYLYAKIAYLVLLPLALMIPRLLAILFVPLFIVTLIVFLLMMGLMSQAQRAFE